MTAENCANGRQQWLNCHEGRLFPHTNFSIPNGTKREQHMDRNLCGITPKSNYPCSEHLSLTTLLSQLGIESTIVSCGWSYQSLGREIIATRALYFVYPSEAASGDRMSEKPSSFFFFFL